MPKPGPRTTNKYSERFKATAVKLSQLRGVQVLRRENRDESAFGGSVRRDPEGNRAAPDHRDGSARHRQAVADGLRSRRGPSPPVITATARRSPPCP